MFYLSMGGWKVVFSSSLHFLRMMLAINTKKSFFFYFCMEFCSGRLRVSCEVAAAPWRAPSHNSEHSCVYSQEIQCPHIRTIGFVTCICFLHPDRNRQEQALVGSDKHSKHDELQARCRLSRLDLRHYRFCRLFEWKKNMHTCTIVEINELQSGSVVRGATCTWFPSEGARSRDVRKTLMRSVVRTLH